MRSDHRWGVTIGLCFLQTAIVAVFTCCGDPADQGSAYKVHKRVCAHGWRSVETSSPTSLTEGSPFLTRAWGQQTLCLKVHHTAATWREARDSCRRQHGVLVDLDFPGFMAPNMVGIIQNLAREIWLEGLRRLWTGMFVERDKLWWENKAPRPVYGNEPGHWWEWLEGQPGQRTGGFGRLDLKNGTNTMSPNNARFPSVEGSHPLFFNHPSSIFRLGMTLVEESNLLPYACINNGFVLPSAEDSKCPAGWLGSPYVDKCLWFSNHQAMSYSAAQGRCRERGGQLAMPQDSFYNAYVTKVILNAELGVLSADDPEVKEGPPGVGGGAHPPSSPQCVFCTNAQSVEKCQPAAEQLNGSCSPDKVCGLKVMKRANGSLAYTGGCFPPSQCEEPSDLSLKHLCRTDESTLTVCCLSRQCLRRLLNVVAAFTCEPRLPLAGEGSSGEQREVECFTCEGAASDEECIAKGRVVRCDKEYPAMKSPVCQTRVWQESRHSRVKIVKQCVSASLCDGVQGECTAISVAPKCVYCCQGHRCNQWLPDNPILRSPLVRRAWIGFQKQESNLLWADGRVTTAASWNTTFGSMFPYLPSSGCGQLWADRPWGSEWLVGNCSTNLPFVCETSARLTDEDLQMKVHPRNISVCLQKLRMEDSDYDLPGGADLSLTCGATNYHPEFPVVWVKDGIYYNNGAPSDGFTLDVTAERLATPGDTVYNLQGQYHCEVWDKRGQRRVRSRPATVRFEDVLTYQASIRIPNHTYNSSVHGQATLLFNSIFRVGLEHYYQMIRSLTYLNITDEELPHHISIKAYRSGSLVIDFSVFYEFPMSNPEELLKIVGYTSDVPLNKSELRNVFEDYFLRILVANIKEKVADKSSSWYAKYGSWGVNPSDVKVWDTAACPRMTTVWRGRTLTWPRTPIGQTSRAEEICVHTNDGRPMGARRCGGNFYSGARWEEPSYHDTCKEEESAITVQLRALCQKAVDKTNVGSVLTEAAGLTGRPSQVVMADVVYTSQILQNVAALSLIDAQSGSKAIATANNLMYVNKTQLAGAQKIANSCNRISTAIESIGRSTRLQDEDRSTFVQSNIIMAMYDMTNKSAAIRGVGYNGRLTNFSERYFEQYPTEGAPNTRTPNIGVTLPPQLRNLVMRVKGNNGTQPGGEDKVRITFTLFQNTDLFIASNLSSKDNTNTTLQTARSLHGAVSVDVRGLKVDSLTEPVLTTFTFQQDVRRENVHCVFWDYSAANGSGDWSTYGCHVNKTSRGRVTCACNHLTTFSVLIDSSDDITNSPRVREVAMTVTLLIGLSVSIAGLGLTLVSFIVFRSLRTSRSQHILFNIAVAALFCNIVFWVGVETVAIERYCIAMAALLHYFLLAAFTWMLVEAILQFLRVVRVPELPTKHFTMKTAIPAWGFPAIVVGVICAVDYVLYALPAHFCWLSGLPLYLGVFLPVGVIFAVTLVISGAVSWKILTGQTARSNKCASADMSIGSGHVFSNVFSFLLLAGTWSLAYLALDSLDATMEMLFCVFDAFFGVYIFLLLHFREYKSREKLRRILRRSRSPTKRDSDSSTASSVGTISSKIVPTLQKSAIHAERNIYVTCPSEKRDVVVKV